MKPESVDEVMQAYDHLTPFKDVVPALQEIGSLEDVQCVVFSNGTKKMITNSLNGSSELASCSSVLSQLISVDHIRSFKPAPEVYKWMIRCVGMTGQDSDVWLVSSNPFDIVGARAAGLKAVWVDRSGKGWQDQLGHEPSEIIHSLADLVDLLKS